MEEGRRAYIEEENEILQRNITIEENSDKIVQKQEQVVISSIASVVKTSTSSCCSGKSRALNRSSSSDSREWTDNEIIELIAIWEEEEALYNIIYPNCYIKQKSDNVTEFLFIINHQFCKYIIEGTCIHTIIQLGLNP